jgi:hypothetical protein
MSAPFAVFDATIARRLLEFGDKAERSSFTQPKAYPRSEGRNEEFWKQGEATKGHWYSKRTAGYLAGYVEFTGSDLFPGEGIPTAEGYVWLDKGVMCSLLVGDCVRFDGGFFQLTEKGQALISPFVPPNAYLRGAAT